MTEIAIAVLVAIGAFLFGVYQRGGRAADADQKLKDMREAGKVRDNVETLDDVGLGERAARWLHKGKD
jgi:hypothetical protein